MALCEKSVWKVVTGLVIAMFVVGLMVSFMLFRERPNSSEEEKLGGINPSLALMATTTLSVQGHEILAYKALTEEERARGLSGTEQISSSSAMLFVFPSDEMWSIWMKDMNYSLDIAWLDRDGFIVSLAERISPLTYVEGNVNKTKFFLPEVPSRYVVEFPAGTVDALKLKKGIQVHFN